MPFDSFVLAAVTHEIDRITPHAQVVKIYQPTDSDVLLHMRASGQRRILLISVHPERFRAHYVTETPDNPASPPMFCMMLRKHLEGAKLIRAEQPGLERVLRLHFSRSDGDRILVAELMGKHSNLVLLDDEGQIIEAIKHVSRRINRVRELLPHRPYVPPPPPRKLDPRDASKEQIRDALTAGGPILTASGMMKALANVGPFAVAETLARAAAPGPEAVAETLFTLLERLRQGEFAPTLLLNDQGEPSDAWAFESRSMPAERQESAPEMSVALEVSRHFGGQAEETERLREEARNRVESQRDREERRLSELRAALEKAGKAEEYRIMGELIQGNAHQIARGQESVELVNYYDPEGAMLRIALSPTLSAKENADVYFQRHRKARSGLPLLQERIAATESHLEELQAWGAEVDQASEERIRSLLAQMEAAHGNERASGSGAQEPAKRPGPGVRRTHSTDGYEIWYGENQEGNDMLTSRLASPTDLWLHVRAGTSAHVVIRTSKRPDDVPPKTLLEAARIAVAHSESKHSGVTPVDYTLKKYVRKPRGSGPGKALYTHEKTLFVESGEK